MLLHPLINQLSEMKLDGIAEALTEQLQEPSLLALDFEERFGLLIEREAAFRHNRLLQSRLRQAKLHIPQACLEDLDYSEDRKINKKQITLLATGDWLR